MKHRHKEIPTCALCTNVEDLLVVGATRLCENCRTCPHGLVHTSMVPETLCKKCVRDMFTDHTFEGPRISNLYDYIDWACEHGIHPAMLPVWTFEEEEILAETPVWFPGEAEEVDLKQLLHRK